MSSIFDSAETLRGQNFSYGLSPFNSVAADSEEFVESDEVSVLVDEEGVVNSKGRILLHEKTDPIDCVGDAKFSEGNKFIEAVNSAIVAVPIGGIIFYPTLDPTNPQRKVIYPDDTPKGFVPCVGQVLEYGGGETFLVAFIPPENPYFPGVRPLQRVREGFKDPIKGGVALEEVTALSGLVLDF